MKRPRIQLSQPSFALCPVWEYFTLTRVDFMPLLGAYGLWAGGGVFIVQYLLLHGISVYTVSSNNRPVKSPPTTRHSYKSLILIWIPKEVHISMIILFERLIEMAVSCFRAEDLVSGNEIHRIKLLKRKTRKA